MNELLDCGIYVILNKKLNIVYVGQTRVNFLIRWLEHLNRIEKYEHDLHRLQLYVDPDTRYIIVKNIDRSKELEFYTFELEAIEFYKERNWIVVSQPTNRKRAGLEYTPNIVTRYKRMIYHMVTFLGTVEMKENYTGRLYRQLYRKIDKQFRTDVYTRSKGNKILDILTTEEMEYILMDLYPRYEAKKVAVGRRRYKDWF